MEIITLEGQALADLFDGLDSVRRVERLRVARDVDGVRFKVNGGFWSPPYPIADEDARRINAQR